MTTQFTHTTVPQLLHGITIVTNAADALPIKLCAEHLGLLGAKQTRTSPLTARAGAEMALWLHGQDHQAFPQGEPIECIIHQPAEQQEKSLSDTEALVQAISGLMAVHGRDRLTPRRLGIEVASVAAGVVATQGLLAALLARSRGYAVTQVETSVLQASLLFLYHHLALATCTDEFVFPDAEAAPGPPFCTADEAWVELEMLTFEAWRAFWQRLGVEQATLLEEGWVAFVYRYLAGRCTLPAALHAATRRYTLAELRPIAEACKVALCRVRTYPEVLAELGWPLQEQPIRTPFDRQLGAPWVICPGIGSAVPERKPTPYHHADGPLTGLRVVEITSRLQGPLAGHLLRLLGADVIKVEPPGGDFGRFAPPLAGSFGAAYLAYNRAKQVVEIDYNQPAGRAQLADLATNADVFLHNWRSGRAEKLGFDFTNLTQSNPRLVYAHASGWGRMDNEPTPIAGDYLVQAYAGCGDGLNPVGTAPFPSRLTLVDVMGGLLACEGILSGLYLRERTGQGCRVDTSLLAGAMTFQSHILQAITQGCERGRQAGRPLWRLLDQPLKTTDGFLMVSVANEQSVNRLARICGLSGVSTPHLLEMQIAEQLSKRTTTEWERLLRAAAIPATVVCNDLSSLPHDPRFTGLLERINNACWAPAAPWQFK